MLKYFIIKKAVALIIEVAETLAAKTDTSIDDQAVKTLKEILDIIDKDYTGG